MSILASHIQAHLERSSWIRRMFEQGIELKKEFGEDQVCDFSLGNPDLPPPAEVAQSLRRIADDACRPYAFGYMPNAGLPGVRQVLAAELAKEQGVPVTAAEVLLSCGAAGGINVLFHTVLDPGDEVVCPAPYFVEYGFYAGNHGGVLKPAPAKPLTFELDLESLDQAITPRTRVVLINSPNNPTGAVYSRGELKALAELLKRRSAGLDRPILLVADEPYRFLAFDGVEVPSVLPLYPHSVVVSSFSKNLSLPGGRIGYLLVNPAMADKDQLMNGLVFSTRVLGFVNAPAIGQELLAGCLGAQVDASVYDARRKAMAKVLESAGYRFSMPKGAFYFFPEAPGGDDVAFIKDLLAERVLAVPGSGFGYPGYFRLAFCVGTEVINRSLEGFTRARQRAQARTGAE